MESSPSSWKRWFKEFHCPECGGQEAYRSRARGFFEKYVVAIMMQPVRCDHCYHRSYAWKSTAAAQRVRVPLSPRSKPLADPKAAGRVA